MTQRKIETAMERALRPGKFVPYKSTFGFVRGLERIANQIERCLGGGRVNVAADSFETFIAACHEKAAEIDDSGGVIGDFVASLFVRWVSAREASNSDSQETVDTLLEWIEEDPFGFCSGLEKRVAIEMTSESLTILSRRTRERLHACAPDDGGPLGYPRRRWTEALKHILRVQGDTASYLELCNLSGVNSGDCNVLADMLESKKSFEEALSWSERGLELSRAERPSGSRHELTNRRRELLVQLGRISEAIDLTWADFRDNPGRYTYEDLMALVPEGQRQLWHKRAMAVSGTGDLRDAIELYLATDEVDRLAASLDAASDEELAEVYYSVADSAAERLATSNPMTAARVFGALGSQMLNEGKSKIYGKALRYMERARDCYVAAGQRDRWESLVEETRAAHLRKKGFMAGFDRVAAGGPARERKPSMVERAKSRWPRHRR